MSSVNLLDWPWIPCSTADGTPVELGIRDVLRQAPTLRALRDPSPMVTVSLHRLLLAVLHRALDGPRTPEQWADWWHAGDWDQAAISGYLDRWEARFNLFDDEAPFLQNPAIVFGPEGTIKDESVKPLAYMIPGMTFGNNTTLFDHSVDERPIALTPAEAARHLVTVQAVALGGFVSTLTHEDRRGKQNLGTSFAGPLARGAVTLVRGDTLFQTLMLNLHQYNHAIAQPFDIGDRVDLPAWERDPDELTAWIRDRPQEELARLPDGYTDLLTWQSRRVRLLPESLADGSLVVRRAAILRGWSPAASWRAIHGETMMAFTNNEKAKEGQDPNPVVGFREDKAAWRDSSTLFQPVEGQPKMLRWLAQIRRPSGMSVTRRFELDLLGTATDRKNISFWRHEQLPLPLALLEDPQVWPLVKRGLEAADHMGQLLTREYSSLPARDGKPQKNAPTPARIFAEAMLPSPGDMGADPATVRAQIGILGIGHHYWPHLEARFWQYLIDLGDGREDAAFFEWLDAVQRQARRALTEVMDSFDYSAQVLRASSLAERAMLWQLRAIAASYGEPEDAEGGVVQMENTGVGA